MDLRLTADERRFRDEVRVFIDANLDPATRARMETGRLPTKDQWVAWHRTLAGRGWSVPDWPKEHGGPGWDPIRRYLFREALQAAPAPQPQQFGTQMVGPVLMAFGTAEQQRRFLPRIVTLEDWWCQGFSEPEAGSDLASLRTTARLDGDVWIVTGQKTWTTLAHWADWMFALVRTDPKAAKPQQGIGFLLIDMRSPGITVRPILTIDGEHEVNEVFLDEVRVPAENMVGDPRRGWDCAKFLLSHERAGQARVGIAKERIRRLKRIAGETRSARGRLIDDPSFRDRLAAIEVEVKALEITCLRVVAAEAKRTGDPAPDPASSLLKIRGSEILQAIATLTLEAAGEGALAAPEDEPDRSGNETSSVPDWAAMSAPLWMNWRKFSIYGGTNEIQRNIMAKAFLGL
ncbi:MAG: acyl-CoA dehydrogenase family protein [Acetobacteraceae bacterium]|nr:acyl-CoA dehydrogenase family protein [Acetobacteraceae bacterium]